MYIQAFSALSAFILRNFPTHLSRRALLHSSAATGTRGLGSGHCCTSCTQPASSAPGSCARPVSQRPLGFAWDVQGLSRHLGPNQIWFAPVVVSLECGFASFQVGRLLWHSDGAVSRGPQEDCAGSGGGHPLRDPSCHGGSVASLPKIGALVVRKSCSGQRAVQHPKALLQLPPRRCLLVLSASGVYSVIVLPIILRQRAFLHGGGSTGGVCGGGVVWSGLQGCCKAATHYQQQHQIRKDNRGPRCHNFGGRRCTAGNNDGDDAPQQQRQQHAGRQQRLC